MNSKIIEILIKHQLTPSIELMEAFRETWKIAVDSAVEQMQLLQNKDEGNDEEDVDETTPITPWEIAQLTRLGIDPGKKFTSKRTTFTVTGYKPNRPKYPVSAISQNGRRFKFPISSVIHLQKQR